MKFFYLASIVFLTLSVTFISCGESESDRIRREAQETLPQTTPTTTTTPASIPAPNTSTASNPEPHYKCPNNCEGGVGPGAGACPICGTDMAHNQAFHNQPGNTTTPSATPSTTINPDGTTPTTVPPPGTQAASPAQNAKGVYHYTCPKGCAGGAAGAGKCASCGADLAHNQEYHN